MAHDGKESNKPYSLTLVVKADYFKQPNQSLEAGLGIVGLVSNTGHQNRAVFVRNSPGFGDVLLLGSMMNRGPQLNEQILDAASAAIGNTNFQYISAVSAHKLPPPVQFVRGSSVTVPILPSIALRPAYFGRDSQIEILDAAQIGGTNPLGGTNVLYLRVSEETPAGRIQPTQPLLQRK